MSDRDTPQHHSEQHAQPTPGSQAPGDGALATERSPYEAARDGSSPPIDGDAAEVIEAQGAAEVEGDLDALVKTAAQRDEYLALAQRTQADFENYRKRVAREAASAAERGVVSLAKELLPALDNLDRAIEAAATDDPLLEVYQPGYRLGAQIIRPARVVVAA